MNEFQVRLHRIQVEPHPDPEVAFIELARIGNFRCVVKKGEFTTGELVAYIPSDSVVPDDLITAMGLEGMLSGKKKNRVKVRQFRGQLSEGLVYREPYFDELGEGEDVQDHLGIIKYEPPLPTNMAGLVEPRTIDRTIRYPLHNIKLFPNMFTQGELVSVTEKLHGTWCCFASISGVPLVASKGLAKEGLSFKINEEENQNNLYVRMYQRYKETLESIMPSYPSDWYVLGEIFGKGVQDLHYGTDGPEFAVFDICIDGVFQTPYELKHRWSSKLPLVPVVYEGFYHEEGIEEISKGLTLMMMDGHIREGIVIKPQSNRYSPLAFDRAIAKSINERYLLRKGGTEYN